MFELTILALLNSVMNWGTAPVTATRTVATDAPTVHALLSDPASQACLVAGINPLLRPHVRPSKTSNPRFLHAHVQLGHRNMLWITWLLTPGRGTTEVDLAAQTESRGILARVLLLAGRRQLRRHLEMTLGSIGAAASDAAENLENVAQAPGTIVHGYPRGLLAEPVLPGPHDATLSLMAAQHAAVSSPRGPAGRRPAAPARRAPLRAAPRRASEAFRRRG